MTAFRSVLSFFEPVFRRPSYVQAAALCLRDGDREQEVLLVTSLTTKRWIVPKGWPMKDHSLADAALIEAWEEAGVIGSVDPEEFGHFTYQKVLKNGVPVSCRCSLFRVHVEELALDWPEKRRRQRRWMPLSEAAKKVDEFDLRRLFRDMGKDGI